MNTKKPLPPSKTVKKGATNKGSNSKSNNNKGGRLKDVIERLKKLEKIATENENKWDSK